MDKKDERTWGTLVHIAGIIGMTFQSTVGNIIAVLVLWLLKRNESAWYDSQGKEAINFQITISFIVVGLNILTAIKNSFWAFGDFFWNNHSFFIWRGGRFTGLVMALNIVFSIIAAIKANKGESYKYPLSLRLVK